VTPHTPQPDISIVVPVRSAEETIHRTLEALLDQCRGLSAEVVAVVSTQDRTARLLRGISGSGIRRIELQRPASVPELRAEGIRAARGRLVAITEDHCLFSPGWVKGLIEAHRERPAAAVGGPVENGRTGGALDWAIYFSRYAGSMPPLPAGPAFALPGNNACYRRETLERHARSFQDGFWENDVNREILAGGGQLWLEPALEVSHNKPYRFPAYLALRYRHARCFGGRRTPGWTALQRAWRALAAPLLPALMAWRAARGVFAKRRRRRELLLSFPALLLCYGVWSWGELAGYLLGPGPSCSQTD